jgi:hypothetical protein
MSDHLPFIVYSKSGCLAFGLAIVEVYHSQIERVLLVYSLCKV